MTFCAPKAAIASAYSRRAIDDLHGKTCMESLIEMQWTNQVDLDFCKEADLDMMYESTGATGLPATFWDAGRPVSTRIGASQPLAVFNLLEVSTRSGKLPLIALNPSKMESILRKLIAAKTPSLGGFSDLESILDSPRRKSDTVRLFFAAVFQRWFAGNGSLVARMDLPERARVDPVSPYHTFDEMFLEPLRRASPCLFVSAAVAHAGVHASLSDSVSAVPAGTPADLTPTRGVPSALRLAFQNKFLATSDQRHFSSTEFHDTIYEGLDVIRDYDDLKNFLKVALEAVALFRPVVREASLELDNSLLDFVDSLKRISNKGAVQPYDILTEISDLVPTLKALADKAYRRVKKSFKRATDTLDADKLAKRQALGSKSNVDPEIMDMMKESFQAFHHFQNNARRQPPQQRVPPQQFQQQFQRQLQNTQQRQRAPGAPNLAPPRQPNNNQNNGTPPRQTTPGAARHHACLKEAADILRGKFPQADPRQVQANVRRLISSERKCLSCRGDMQAGPNRVLVCAVNCVRPGLHPHNRAAVQSCAALQ